MRIAPIASLLLLTVASASATETFRLGGGREVRGQVVRETEETVFVDVGFAILSVPKREILTREAEAAAGAKSEADRVTTSRTALFSSIDRSETTVKENVDRCGGAVVMITSPGGLGSGFIITPDGYVITNDHVIQGETRISVTIFGKDASGSVAKRKLDDVRIVATNAYVDLALLKLDNAGELPVAYLGESAQVKVGQPCFAIGNPLGLERTVSEGIVSTLTRPFDGLTYLQTTTPINPGNSGGPLFNLKGEVIGVTNMKATFTEGLNFAIPVDRVKEFLRERDAFAYEKDHPNTGFRYFPAPRKKAPAPKD